MQVLKLRMTQSIFVLLKRAREANTRDSRKGRSLARAACITPALKNWQKLFVERCLFVSIYWWSKLLNCDIATSCILQSKTQQQINFPTKNLWWWIFWISFRESSFNITRGMKILRGGGGGLRKFLDTRKGGPKNLYTSKPTGGRAPKKIELLAGERGVLKFQALSFNIFIPPCHIKWTFPYRILFKYFFREQAQCPDENTMLAYQIICAVACNSISII